jgi:PmbA protein
LSGALNGGNVLLGSSFLAGKEGEAVASKVVTLIADGTLPRGVASSPVDGEGVPTARNVLIDRGVLKGYLYNTYAAAKAKKKSTGSAWRESYSELPDIGTGNFFFQRGDRTPENIIEATTEGFYVFEASGFGVNPVTGGYSLGATGVWVKDGRLSQPVARVTIASNISQMLLNLDLMGSDLSFDHGWTCPHFRVQHMMVSGVE